MATTQPLMEPSTAEPQTAPKAQPQPAAARTLPLPTLLPAVASGVLLWACYHPLAWGWLAWVALVPLLCLVRSTCRPRHIYLSAWVGGFIFFMAALQWMGQADQTPFPKWPMHGAWLLLAIYCALYVSTAIYLTPVLERRTRLPLVITFPAVWVALEFARSFMLSGFAWYYLAHSQHEYLSMIQITDLGGAYAVSLLVAAVNAIVFDILYQFKEVRAFLKLREPPAGQRTFGDDWPDWSNVFLAAWRRGIVLESCGVAIVIGAAYLYGSWRLEQPQGRPGPRVALLQGNLDQRLRNDGDLPADKQLAGAALQARVDKARSDMLAHYNLLCKRADQLNPAPHLFIWPETSLPEPWVDVAPEIPINAIPENWLTAEADSRSRLNKAFGPLNTPQLVGLGTFFLDAQRKLHRYNSALLLNANGQAEARYDKVHRVPFGEFVPLRDWLPFMKWLVPYDFDYSIDSGEHLTRFQLGDYHFGMLICYEDTDPFLARRYARTDDDGAPVDFLVNISNDGWFNGSSEHEEHLAVSRFRAIECRRAMVRSVNMGISAVIDANGRVLDARQVLTDPTRQPELDANSALNALPIWAVEGIGGSVVSMPHADWAAHKKVAGVLMSSVPIDDRYSFYAAAGDWLPGLCWAMIGVCTIGIWVYSRLRPARA